MTHTWELHTSYHACPKCGHILENRKKVATEMLCPYCKERFAIKIKQAQKSEFDWS